MRKQRRSKDLYCDPSSTDSAAQGIAILIGLPIIAVLSYKALSIDFLRPFAIGGLIVVAAVLISIAAILLYALFPRAGSRKKQLLSEGKPQIDPQILQNLLTANRARSKIIEIVDEHIETLARRRLVLLKVDHYGIVDGSEWNKEVQRFIDKVVRPRLSDDEAGTIARNMNAIFQELIEDRASAKADEIEANLKFPLDLTPELFERWCAATLAERGWKALTTKATGDQGADVVAEKGSVRIVLQCKLYATPVGNKAVQEAYAAQRHYATDASAVVTNNEFTRSARDLANTTRVLLLHYGDLSRLDELLAERRLNDEFATLVGRTP